MGMFDTVLVKCPNCGELNAFQSKGGECLLRTYTLEEAPPDVLSDVNRHSPYTCSCGVELEVRLEPITTYKASVVWAERKK